MAIENFWKYSGLLLLASMSVVAAWVAVDKPAAMASEVPNWLSLVAIAWAAPYFMTR